MSDESQRIEPINWPAPVLRVTLRWDGSNWRIESTHRVESMTLPVPDSLPEGEKSRGFWIEAIDRQGRVRYREVMADPLAGMEQFEEGGDVIRLPHPRHDIAIEVLIPDLPDLAELHIVSNPVPQTGQEPSQEAQRSKLKIGRGTKKSDKDQEHRDDDEHNPSGRHS